MSLTIAPKLSLQNFGLKPKLDLALTGPHSDECFIEAAHDLEAVSFWLKKYSHSPNTYKAYEKEARRLLLWCAIEKGRGLAKLKADDFEDYFLFLQNPPENWISKNPKAKMSSRDWRPFSGELSQGAYFSAIRIINSLMNFLNEANYLPVNPIKLTNKNQSFSLDSSAQKFKVWTRMLEEDEWETLLNTLGHFPETTPDEIDVKLKTQLLVAMLYFLGLRLNEVATHSWNAFREKNNQWWFFVKGKGGKEGHVPVNEQLLDFVKKYRAYLGKSELPNLDEQRPIFVSKKTKRALSARSLYTLIKNLGEKVADAYPDEPEKQEKFRKLSPHWLRHLSASHQDKVGIPATIIQENHRHSSFETTKIYLHAEDDRRFSEMQKMKMEVELSVPEAQFNQDFTFELALKAGALSSQKDLEFVINKIKTQVLKGLDFMVKSSDNIENFETNKKFGRAFKMSFTVSGVLQPEREFIKLSIERQARLRMFSAAIEVLPSP